jgi:NRPS condensation-like uncharacterized protein
VSVDLYPRLARMWLTLAVGVAGWSWWQAPTRVGLALAIWLTIRALCVPQRRLLVEVLLLAAASVGIAEGVGTGVATAFAGLFVLEAIIQRTRLEVATQPLVGFDLCHLLLTSPIRPSTTHHFLELSAPLDRAALVRALTELIGDVDRLRTFVREAPLGLERFVARHAWVDPATLVEWHDVATDPVDTGWFERRIEVSRTPPIRLFHARHPANGYLLGLTLHHSVADGTGAMMLLDGLLRRYDRARGREVRVPEIPSTGPRCRRLAWWHGGRAVAAMLRSAARQRTWRVRSASLLDDESPRPARFRQRLLDVPVSTWQAVVAAAGVRACTPNHFLMAASLRAADAVRRARGLADETFRVVVPSDLRKLFGLPRSLPNYIGTVPLEMTASEVRAPSLPSRVRDRVQAGRAPEAQMRFPIQIGLLGLLPPAVGRRVLHAFDQDPRTFAFSFLFSHIRVPRELHLPMDNEVVRLWCASSQGRQPAFGVAITTIGERTWALLQYLSPYVADDAVEQFGQELGAQLQALTAEVGAD